MDCSTNFQDINTMESLKLIYRTSITLLQSKNIPVLLNSKTWFKINQPTDVKVHPINFFQRDDLPETGKYSTSLKQLKIYFQNIGGIHFDFDVIIFVETWLSADFFDEEHFQSNFRNVFRKYRYVESTDCLQEWSSHCNAPQATSFPQFALK